MESTAPFDLTSLNLSELEFWSRPWHEREAAFRALRRERPIAFFEEPEVPGITRGNGYFAITRHADILEMSRRPDAFCSGDGATSIVDLPPVMNEFYGSMINMDDPRHQRLRGIVSKTFTPRMVQNVLDNVERVATRVIDDVVEKGEIDFVAEIAARLPLIIICDMMGIAEGDHQLVFEKSNIILSGGDPEYVPEGADPVPIFLQAGAELAQLVRDLAAYRRAGHPGDDLTSALANTEVDGERLSDDEIASFFILLTVAGNETTRTAISHGLVALRDNPDQRRLWTGDFERVAPTAVEEIVRWATPVIYMRRTATRDVEVSGHQFHAGDKVALFYNSGNRDEAVFDAPHRFDVRRDPNPHVGFGGPGPHFCLGAHLARREIAVMFRELFRRLPDLEIVADPVPLRSMFINGIKRLPATFTPSARDAVGS